MHGDAGRLVCRYLCQTRLHTIDPCPQGGGSAMSWTLPFKYSSVQMVLQGAMHLLHELLCFFALLPAQQSWALQQQLCQIPLKPASAVLYKATNQELSVAYLRSVAMLTAG